MKKIIKKTRIVELNGDSITKNNKSTKIINRRKKREENKKNQ